VNGCRTRGCRAFPGGVEEGCKGVADVIVWARASTGSGRMVDWAHVQSRSASGHVRIQMTRRGKAASERNCVACGVPAGRRGRRRRRRMLYMRNRPIRRCMNAVAGNGRAPQRGQARAMSLARRDLGTALGRRRSAHAPRGRGTRAATFLTKQAPGHPRRCGWPRACFVGETALVVSGRVDKVRSRAGDADSGRRDAAWSGVEREAMARNGAERLRADGVWRPRPNAKMMSSCGCEVLWVCGVVVSVLCANPCLRYHVSAA
jgi:hypothetical protein